MTHKHTRDCKLPGPGGEELPTPPYDAELDFPSREEALRAEYNAGLEDGIALTLGYFGYDTDALRLEGGKLVETEGDA
jgi:hypothetical protein